MPRDTGARDVTRVVALRRASLERAGLEPSRAAETAALLEIPLQDALRLVRAGLPPDVAFELTSGERRVF